MFKIMAAPKGNKYALGNNGGAPSQYDPEYCQAIIDYFTVDPYYIEEINHYGKNGALAWVDKKRMSNPLPKFHEFAGTIGVTHATLLNWCKSHEEFFEAYERAKELQKFFLIENGLNGCYNPSSFIFVAKNITDMKDKQEHEVSGVSLRFDKDDEKV